MPAIPVKNVLRPRYIDPFGHLLLTNEGGGAFGRKTNANITFDRTKAYSWQFFLKLAEGDTRFQQVILHGSLGNRGYRINKNYVGGRHCLELQEVKSYSARRMYYPRNFNPYEDHEIQISWKWNGLTSIDYRFYVDGIQLTETDSALTWSNFVDTLPSDKLDFGYDWDQQTVNGEMHHIRYYEGIMLQNNDAYMARKKQISRLARRYLVGRWDAQDGGGSTLTDTERGNNLTMFNNFYITSPDASRTFTSIWPSGLQFNYGNFGQHGPGYGSTFMQDSDFDMMWHMGVRKLRIGTGNYAYTQGVDTVKGIALRAQDYGFGIVLVGGPTGGDDASWSTSEAQAVQLGEWCEANSIAEYQPFNEFDAPWSKPGLTDRVNKIKAVGTLVKAVYNGVLSNACAQDGHEAEWISSGMGPFDRLGYNVYGSDGDFEDWKAKITTFHNAFGDDMYVSEWNLHHDWPFSGTETEQAAEILARTEWLRDVSGVDEAFFFTLRWSILVNDQFALIKSADGRIREWITGLATED